MGRAVSQVRLESDRLILRTGRAADVPAIVRFLRENRSFHRTTSPWRRPDFFTEGHWRKRVRVHRDDALHDRALRLFLFERDAPARVIGFVNFSNFVRGAFRACHLGYALDRNAEGRGYMTEALRIAIAHMFGRMKFHRIMANYLPANRRSARVLKRLGFRIEGRARAYLLIAGRWRDHVLTSLVHYPKKTSASR